MRAAYWIVGVSAAFAMLGTAACKVTVVDDGVGGSGTTSSTTKASSTTTSTKASSGVGTTTASSGTGGGVGPFADPVCNTPSPSPSDGACYTPQMNGCNPITGTPCVTGEACDFSDATEFECYPGDNSGTLCGTCDPANQMYCGNGLTCLQTDLGVAIEEATEFKCFKYCCTDADCGGAAGSCNLDIFADVFGVCATITQ